MPLSSSDTRSFLGSTAVCLSQPLCFQMHAEVPHHPKQIMGWMVPHLFTHQELLMYCYYLSCLLFSSLSLLSQIFAFSLMNSFYSFKTVFRMILLVCHLFFKQQWKSLWYEPGSHSYISCLGTMQEFQAKLTVQQGTKPQFCHHMHSREL